MEVKCVVANSPCDIAVLKVGLIGLALNAWIHDVVPADGTVDPGADFVGVAPEPVDPGNFAADSQPDVPPTAALDQVFAPEPVAEPVPTFDPVAETVSVVADAGASQGAAPAPEPVVAESAPEPAPAPEPVVDDAPPPAPEPDIV